MKLLNKYMAIFKNLSPTSNHLHPLQVENCDSNSRLVVDEDDNVKSGLKRLKEMYLTSPTGFSHRQTVRYFIDIKKGFTDLFVIKMV